MGLEKDARGRLVRAAGGDELDRVVEVGFAVGELLRQRQRVAGLDQHVEPPALHLGALVIVVGLDRLGHFSDLAHLSASFALS